jgi:urea transport system substrate-binding protein
MQAESLCPSPDLLRRLQANALPHAEAERLREHLARCPACLSRALGGAPPQADSPTRLADSGPSSDYPFLAPPQGPGELGRLGDYRILGVLGEGGMGIVFAAEDAILHRRVALKVLKPSLAQDEKVRQRFLQEARAAAGLPGDHVVRVFQVGEQDGVPFIAMEHLQGESLETRLARERWLPVAEALAITRQAAEGLAVAHERGLVHRDIKPANLWLETLRGEPGASATGGGEPGGSSPRANPEGSPSWSSSRFRVKLLDFGLVRQMQGEPLTLQGQVLGTPGYMAPEQAAGRPVDARADWFSLGCVLYRMLTGEAPFDPAGPDTRLVLERAILGEPPPAEQVAPHLPASIADLLRQMLARKPDDRPASAASLLDRLRALESARPSTVSLSATSAMRDAWPPHDAARRRGRWVNLSVWAGAATVIAAALVVFVLGFLKHFQRPAGGPGGPPIKVGVLHSFSGVLAETERPVAEMTLWAIDEINKAGGVGGRQLEPISADGASDEQVFAAEARKLIEQDGVTTIFGCWTSAARKRVAAVCKEFDRLLVYPSTYEGLEESPNVFYLGALPNELLLPVIRYARRDLDRHHFFLVGSEDVYSKAVHAILKDEIRRKDRHGRPLGTVAGDVYFPFGTDEFRATVKQIKESEADIVINSMGGQNVGAFFRAARAGGIRPPAVPTVWLNVGEHELGALDRRAEGDYAPASYFESLDTPGNRAFLKRFHAHFKGLRSVNDTMQTAYLGVYLWKQAVEQAGSTDTGPLRAALKHQQIEGPEGPIRIDPKTQNAWRMARIGRVSGARQFKVVWQSPEPLPPQPFPPTRTRQQWQEFLARLYKGWGNHWEKHAR